jgi:hypothetical protein
MLGCVVGVLRGLPCCLKFLVGQRVLQPLADGLQSLAELPGLDMPERARQPAPADILGQDGLLRLGGKAIVGDQLLGEFDRGEVVARLDAPAARFL